MVPLTALLQVATEYGAVASRGAGASDASSGTVAAWSISSAIEALPFPPWVLALSAFALWGLLRRRERGSGLLFGAVMIAAVVGTLVYMIARSQNLL
jgi:hypothetical protein